MCLYITKDAKLKHAVKDIVCYKVVKRYTTFLGKQILFTPYTQSPLTDAQLSGKEDFCSFDKDEIEESKIGPGYEVSKGFIHTCINLESARWLSRLLSLGLIYGEDIVVYKCIIPKGTRYYEGKWALSPQRESYASKRIRFVEELKSK